MTTVQEPGYHDEDGAVFFEGGAGETQVHLRLPPDVPVPSREMVRRHRAAGHCPYRPWCEECLRGASKLSTTIADAPNNISASWYASSQGAFATWKASQDRDGDRVKGYTSMGNEMIYVKSACVVISFVANAT